MSSNRIPMMARKPTLQLNLTMKSHIEQTVTEPKTSKSEWWLITLLCQLIALSVFAEERTIHIGTLPGLKYDMKQFDVRPADEVKIIFNNQDTMLHNLVILKPGSRVEIISAALALGTNAAERQYVPDSPKVLWATSVVASGESVTLEFTAPNVKGDYPYVCTYPGHGFIMFGNMRVTDHPGEPEMNTGPAVAHTNHQHHAEKAIVKRTFMPNAGPASIAVRLPGGHSYCWDAGANTFRYAWKGGFVESVYRKPDKLLGYVYYRESHTFPFLIGKENPQRPLKVQFFGYTLDNAGIPEFDYEANGIHFRERLEVRDNRLVRRFQTKADHAVDLWFPLDPNQTAQLDSTGTKEGRFYRFSGKEANEFFITISSAFNR